MDPENFTTLFSSVTSDLGRLISALDASPDLIGSMSLADYFLLNDLTRVFLLHREV